jgi:hypothetical protein
MAKVAEAAGEAAGAAEMGALGGMGDMGDMGGTEDVGGMEDMAADVPVPDDAAAPAEESTGFDGLLATPEDAGPPAGKRDEGDYMWHKVKKQDMLGNVETTTSKSKGKWHKPTPEDLDKRKSSGPRKKNMMSQGGHRQGGRRGMGLKYNFDSLAKGIVSENKANYNIIAEKKLFRSGNEIENLIKDMEKKRDEIETQ